MNVVFVLSGIHSTIRGSGCNLFSKAASCAGCVCGLNVVNDNNVLCHITIMQTWWSRGCQCS